MVSEAEFIKKHRKEIDDYMRGKGNNIFTDRERSLWIQNDYGLYTWAKRKGVKI